MVAKVEEILKELGEEKQTLEVRSAMIVGKKFLGSLKQIPVKKVAEKVDEKINEKVVEKSLTKKEDK